MAVTFEQAKQHAQQIDRTINTCTEYQSAYHFFDKNNDSIGYSGVVVLKENGKIINWIDFILHYHPERNPILKSL